MALKLTPTQERSCLLCVIDGNLLDDPCTPLEVVLQSLEELHPSHALGTGGILFEAYLLRVTRPSHFTLLHTALSQNLPLPDEAFNILLKAHALPFWFHIICTARVL